MSFVQATTGNTSTSVARVQLLQVVPAAAPFTLWVLCPNLAKKSYEAKVEEEESRTER